MSSTDVGPRFSAESGFEHVLAGSGRTRLDVGVAVGLRKATLNLGSMDAWSWLGI